MLTKSEEIFFNKDNGLTSTQANHLANIAKELYQTDLDKANKVSFVSSYITIAGSDKVYQTTKGMSLEEYKSINLGRIGQLNTFCAWMREAIKAKDKALERLDEMVLADYVKMNNLTYTNADIETFVSDEEAISQLSKEDRFRYYQLEAEASVLGKQIHPNQSLQKAINEVRDAILCSTQLSSTNHNDIITERKSEVEIEALESHFISLQAIHRKLNAELNTLKQKIKDIKMQITRDRIEERNKCMQARAQETEKYTIQFQEFLTNKREEIAKLKIVIPAELQDIYNELCKIAGA